MTVYLEQVLLDNFAIDFVLLLSGHLTMRLTTKKWRVALGAIVGALFALLGTQLNGAWLYVAKALCLASMCAVVLGFHKALVWYILIVLAYTFLLGGFLVGVGFLTNNTFVADDGTLLGSACPLWLVVAVVLSFCFLVYLLVTYQRQSKRNNAHITKGVVCTKNEHTVLCFCDTGNSLRHNGVPVCFVTKAFDGFADYFAEQVAKGKSVQISVGTVAGTTNVLAVGGVVRACGKQLNVFLALPVAKVDTPYHILLCNDFCEVQTI